MTHISFPGGDATLPTVDAPQYSTRIDPNALPYRILHGWMECSALYCRTWREALAIARILRASYEAEGDKRKSVSIYDMRSFDGDKRGGLTEEQYLEWIG